MFGLILLVQDGAKFTTQYTISRKSSSIKNSNLFTETETPEHNELLIDLSQIINISK